MITRYWKKMKTHFSCKCEDQVDKPDGRQLRKYVNPKTNAEGQVWEYRQKEFSGLVDSLYIENKEVEFDGRKFRVFSLNIGIQSNGYVDVLQIPVKTQSGKLTKDFVAFARKAQNIDFSKDLYVDIWENFKGAKQREDGTLDVPVHLLFKYNADTRYPKSYKSSFEYDESSKKYIGVPEPDVTESCGEKVYDFSKQNDFYYNIVSSVIAANEDTIKSNRESRPATENEISASQNPQPVAVPAGDIEEDVPF